MKWLWILICCLVMQSIIAKPVVNVFCWTAYIPNAVIQQFEKQTGITVNFSQYSSNEAMYTKLKINPNAGYDVIVPSSYFIIRMTKQHMLHRLNKKYLPNIHFIASNFLNANYDPGNHYSIPFFWGATIIAVNKKYIHPNTVTDWQDLWQSRFNNQLLLISEIRDSFAIALLANHQSINSRNPKIIKQAYLRLHKLWPNVKILASDAVTSLLADEDITIGTAWNGDIFAAQQDNPNVVAIYPKGRFPIWIDNLVIAKHAPNLANAYKFINFLLQPKINAEIARYVGYSTPNIAARKLLPPKERNSPILYPAKRIFQRGEFENYIGNADDDYKYYWERFRAGV